MECRTSTGVRYPALTSGLLSLLLVAAVLTALRVRCDALTAHLIAPPSQAFGDLVLNGSALARAALRRPEVLPVIGASEAIRDPSSYQSGRFFADCASGFVTFEIARAGAASLTEAQIVAGLGSLLRGRRIAISFTPSAFDIKRPTLNFYRENYTLLHANQLVFSTDLDLALKSDAADAMLLYARHTPHDPLLTFALRNLAQDTTFHHALYFAVWPLGIVQTAILEAQDRYLTIQHLTKLKRYPHRHSCRDVHYDWPALVQEARAKEAPHNDNNPFGFNNGVWTQMAPTFKTRPLGKRDTFFRNRLRGSEEWDHLDILLRTLTQLGAKPILLGRPMNAAYYDARGVSSAARRSFYRKMRQHAKAYNVPLVDFHEFEDDKYFDSDRYGHTSREGWIYVDKALDDFFHGGVEQ